uniref:Uncharacterized protein n=1 Tax=Ixodes ricinus TaxID=34613 RepID=A0A6B0UBB6_IXORI
MGNRVAALAFLTDCVANIGLGSSAVVSDGSLDRRVEDCSLEGRVNRRGATKVTGGRPASPSWPQSNGSIESAPGHEYVSLNLSCSA